MICACYRHTNKVVVIHSYQLYGVRLEGFHSWQRVFFLYLYPFVPDGAEKDCIEIPYLLCGDCGHTAALRLPSPGHRNYFVDLHIVYSGDDTRGTLCLNLYRYNESQRIDCGYVLAKNTSEHYHYDMYPLYWTPSRGGIIMRYTYEYKRKCVELYREGKWPETPEGVSNKSFRDKVRLWVRAEDSRGPEALKHKNFNRNWTPEERLELVSQVMSGKSCVSVAIEAGIQDRLLYQWVQNYKTKGYNGLVEMKKGRPSKGVPQMKKEEARPLNESEREELIRLRAENEYIKAENEVIKKEIALREERHAAQLKARKQRSSKSCVKKDTN